MLLAGTAAAEPADLCQELLAYVEKKAAEPPAGTGDQTPAPAAAPLPRADGHQTGTQGGGSVSSGSSSDLSAQSTAPTTTPVAPGAAPEPAVSPHASDVSTDGPRGGATLQQVRETASGGDRQACRDTVQKLRRAGAELPAALVALAAYEPDVAKR